VEKASFDVRILCKVLEVSVSAYYEWECEQQSAHERRDDELSVLIRRFFAEFRGRYRAPRIQRELAKAGVGVSRKRVARLMRENGLFAKSRRKYKATTDSNHALPVAPNLLEQRFDAGRPNTVWVSDITYLRTRQGWMYLAVIIDLFSRKVVGWSSRNVRRASTQVGLDQTSASSAVALSDRAAHAFANVRLRAAERFRTGPITASRSFLSSPHRASLSSLRGDGAMASPAFTSSSTSSGRNWKGVAVSISSRRHRGAMCCSKPP
jgi:transposase InsO family protein